MSEEEKCIGAQEGLHVLLGVAGLSEEQAKDIIDSLIQHGAPIARYATRYRKFGVDEYLHTEKDVDILLLSECLEGASP